jgi:hypothetical protein
VDSQASDADAIGIYPVHWECTKVDSEGRNADFIGVGRVHWPAGVLFPSGWGRRAGELAQLALVRFPFPAIFPLF